MNKWSIMGLVILSLTLLTACKPEEKQNKAKSTATESTQQTSSNQSSISNTETSTQQVPLETSLDLQAIANGDFTSILGSYEANGGTYTINNDGSFTYKKSDGEFKLPITAGQVKNEMAVLASNNIIIYVIPAGTDSPIPVPDFLGADDSTRNRVIIDGEGMNLFFLD